MAATGNYLYGFTEARMRPGPGLRGLADAPVRLIGFRDIAAVVSDHPMENLIPRRANLEPHHRIVRMISSTGPLVPAAFGHISQNEEELVGVLRENYDDIRDEIERLSNKAELGIRLSWNVPNIFDYFVCTHEDLRKLRNRVFSNADPPMQDKLQVGELFAALLERERERLGSMLLSRLLPAVSDSLSNPPRSEKTVCDYAVLIECARAGEFAEALRQAALLFDSSYTLNYSGPWPPYSFVRLQLHTAAEPAWM